MFGFFGCIAELFKCFRQAFARCRAAINHQSITKHTLLFRGEHPVTESGNIWIDQALFVGAPAGRMSGIGGMIENGNAEYLVSEWALDVAPGSPLLFAGTITQA